MTGHPTVVVRVGDWTAPIDKEIAPLIKEIWKAGIGTVLSCQENQPGITWIAFVITNVADFLHIVVGEYNDEIDSLYNRIRQEWEDSKRVGWWEYEIFSQGFPMVSIRFPKTDIPILVERLQAKNTGIE